MDIQGMSRTEKLSTCLKLRVSGISPDFTDEHNHNNLMSTLETNALFGSDFLYRGCSAEELKFWRKNNGPISFSDALSDDLTDRVCAYTYNELQSVHPSDPMPANRGPVFWAYDNDPAKPMIIVFRKKLMTEVGPYQYKPVEGLKPRRLALAAELRLKPA